MAGFYKKSLSIVSACLLVSCSNTTTFYNNPPPYSPSTTRSEPADEPFWQGGPQTVWDRLQHIRLSKLEKASLQVTDPTKAAWIKLAIISKRYHSNSSQLAQQLQEWRAQNPSQPGNAIFNQDGLLQLSQNDLPRHIALLLPLQGQNGASGQAVRDGFLSAYYQNKAKTKIQQTISFYDTSGGKNISTLYQEALNAGADRIVGPLLKEEVQSLAAQKNFSVPTLALNYSEGSLAPNFYEFGLSPVDEAQQTAEKAWHSGRSKAIVITSQNAWGQRVSQNLLNRWKTLGGTAVETFYFNNRTNFSQAIPALLHVNIQEDRKKMEEENNRLALEKQRRQDFDVIFLLADPKSAREIVPLLRYYYAENVPVYATSSIYSGSPNPQKDTDLNGVIFADIPWLIRTSHNTNRLYAVGRDAYTISNELGRLTRLPNFPIYAATGALTLTSSHQIYRRLPWTKMHNGHP